MDELGLIYALYCECPHCDPDEARYVGQTIRTLEERLAAHLEPRSAEMTPRYKWVHSHGSRNIRAREIEKVPVTDLDIRERAWISELNTFVLDNPRGKNSTRGGDISFMGEDELAVLRAKRLIENFNARKLDWPTVREIRDRYANSSDHVEDIAEQFGIAAGTAYAVIMNVNWYDANYTYQVRSRKGKNTGERAGGATLTWTQVRTLRSRFKAGDKVKDIARDIGVLPTTVKNIGYMQTWPDPEYDPPSELDVRNLRVRKRREERFTPDIRDEVILLLESGTPVEEIPKAAGCSRNDLDLFLKGAIYPGVADTVKRPRLRTTTLPPDIQDRIRDKLREGLSIAEVARSLGVSRPTVRKYSLECEEGNG